MKIKGQQSYNLLSTHSTHSKIKQYALDTVPYKIKQSLKKFL